MTASVFDLFKLGVGPSSSHTMGPMTAAVLFVGRLRDDGKLLGVARVEIRLYASLALTGRGHATDRAVMLGLMGFVPADLDPDAGEAALLETRATQSLKLGGQIDIAFDEARDLVWLGHERLPQHPNGLTFVAYRQGRRRAGRAHLFLDRRRLRARRVRDGQQRAARGRP